MTIDRRRTGSTRFAAQPAADGGQLAGGRGREEGWGWRIDCGLVEKGRERSGEVAGTPAEAKEEEEKGMMKEQWSLGEAEVVSGLSAKRVRKFQRSPVTDGSSSASRIGGGAGRRREHGDSGGRRRREQSGGVDLMKGRDSSPLFLWGAFREGREGSAERWSAARGQEAIRGDSESDGDHAAHGDKLRPCAGWFW